MSEAELYRLKGEALLGGAAPFEAEAQARGWLLDSRYSQTVQLSLEQARGHHR